MIRVDVRPELLRWARQRSGLSAVSLASRFPRLDAWETGDARPTLKQIERFAKATYTPVGTFFLERPPEERVPIPDLRTVAGEPVGRPTPNLLDTIYICQQRQEWYHNFARSTGEERLSFVGSARTTDDVVATAERMRASLRFDLEECRRIGTWTEALRRFSEQADDLGILVMCNGVVLNNNHRRLDPDEFRGFALADEFAPVVFVNGADTKAAQMFTLAHELAHIWLGQSALSDAEAVSLPDREVERWCNQVAAELLVPLDALRDEFDPDAELEIEMARLARRFKTSTLVVLRRIYDAGGLTRQAMWDAYRREEDRLRAFPRGSGGNFYLTEAARFSKRFGRALVVSTLGGDTLYRDAFRMLGISKHSTFEEFGRSLGVAT